MSAVRPCVRSRPPGRRVHGQQRRYVQDLASVRRHPVPGSDIVSTLHASDEKILLKHGAGGRAMRRLIEEAFLRAFVTDPPAPAGTIGLAAMDDGGAVRIGDRWLVVTTDSHVIKPPFFPGGDIGRLAVAGTVNDLAVMGATDVL